jgi:hypothetical protein
MSSSEANTRLRGPDHLIPIRRTEKPWHDNHFYGERDGHHARQHSKQTHFNDGRVSRYDTAERTPLWDGPRYNAPFVAQVLGQILTATPQRAPSALAAYRKAATLPPTLVFDRKA